MHDNIIAWIGTAAIGLTGAGVVIKKYGPKIVRALGIARDTLDLVDDVLDAIQPDADGNIKITPEEVKKFELQAAKLRANFEKGENKK